MEALMSTKQEAHQRHHNQTEEHSSDHSKWQLVKPWFTKHRLPQTQHKHKGKILGFKMLINFCRRNKSRSQGRGIYWHSCQPSWAPARPLKRHQFFWAWRQHKNLGPAPKSCSSVQHRQQAVQRKCHWAWIPLDHSTAAIPPLSPGDLQTQNKVLWHSPRAPPVGHSCAHFRAPQPALNWKNPGSVENRTSQVPRSAFLWVLEKYLKWLSQTLVPSPSLIFTLNLIQIRLNAKLREK